MTAPAAAKSAGQSVGWRALKAELDRWGALGRTAQFWIRDDDAAAPSDALDRLVGIAGEAGAPLALAVIPVTAGEALARRLEDAGNVTILQHGYAHLDHAGPGGKKCEIGAERPAEYVIAELALGQERLADLFADLFLPVLVPPWNRIAPHIVPMLPELGYVGLSTYLARSRAHAAPGLVQINTHADIVDWKGARGFVGDGRALGAILAHLADRREDRADAAEPTGLLTHHLVHDQACEAFVRRLTGTLAGHPAAEFAAAPALFPEPGGR